MRDSIDEAATPARNTLDYVIATLREGILSGRYVPGQRLVEADLTRDLKVSRGPVRESFRLLSAEGLVETVPNRSTVVRRYSKKEMLELFEIRTQIEMLAARLAATRIGQGDHARRFRKAIEPIWNERARLPSEYFDENRRFHQAIANVSGNERLRAMVYQMQLPLIMFQLRGALSHEVLAQSVAEHRRVAEAILDGNARRAEAEIRRHLKRASAIPDRMSPGNFGD